MKSTDTNEVFVTCESQTSPLKTPTGCIEDERTDQRGDVPKVTLWISLAGSNLATQNQLFRSVFWSHNLSGLLAPFSRNRRANELLTETVLDYAFDSKANWSKRLLLEEWYFWYAVPQLMNESPLVRYSSYRLQLWWILLLALLFCLREAELSPKGSDWFQVFVGGYDATSVHRITGGLILCSGQTISGNRLA